MNEIPDRMSWIEPVSPEYMEQHADWNDPVGSEKLVDKRAEKENKPSPPEPLKIVDPRTLHGLAVPERQWIIRDWLPIGYTTALYGDGGTGKTLLAQQLMTSCAVGKPWLGKQVLPCRTLALFCEDDEDELHRRQDAINAQYGIDFSDLHNLRWVSGVGANNLLFTFASDGVGMATDRMDQLTAASSAFEAKLVIVDTAADTFGGNENDRNQVRQYIGAGLNRLARSLNGGKGGAVLLNAHPSRSGLSASGDLDGGSTGWSNSVRSRWSLTRPNDEDTPKDTDERILTRRKANYAGIGEEIRMRWQRGALVPMEQVSGGISTAITRAAAESVFLTLLDEHAKQGRFVSASRNAGNFAPKAFAKSPGRNGHSRKDFEQAMEGLFTAGTIVVGEYGRSGDVRKGIVRAAKEGHEIDD